MPPHAPRRTGRELEVVLVAFALVSLVPLACSSSSADDPGTPARTDGGVPGVDAAPRREAGVPTKCATYAESTASDRCACGETAPPFSGPATDACPAFGTPHFCVSYDISSPAPIHRECACEPKCLFQRVAAGGGGGDGGAGTDTCRCGVSSHLVLGGGGSKDEARASCDGFAVCCRASTGCDCTSDAAYSCPGDTQQVASCTPADFNEMSWKSLVYGSPIYSDVIAVPTCR